METTQRDVNQLQSPMSGSSLVASLTDTVVAGRCASQRRNSCHMAGCQMPADSRLDPMLSQSQSLDIGPRSSDRLVDPAIANSNVGNDIIDVSIGEVVVLLMV